MGACWTMLQTTTFYFASFLCHCVILPTSNSEALQNVEELNRKYQVGNMMDFIMCSDSSDTYSSTPSARAARSCGIQPVRHSWGLHRRHPTFLQRHRRSQTASQWPKLCFNFVKWFKLGSKINIYIGQFRALLIISNIIITNILVVICAPLGI